MHSIQCLSVGEVNKKVKDVKIFMIGQGRLLQQVAEEKEALAAQKKGIDLRVEEKQAILTTLDEKARLLRRLRSAQQTERAALKSERSQLDHETAAVEAAKIDIATKDQQLAGLKTELSATQDRVASLAATVSSIGVVIKCLKMPKADRSRAAQAQPFKLVK